jgi:hypothetical protein
MAKYLFVVCVERVVSALLLSGFIAAPCFHSESPAKVPAVLLRLTRMKSGFARVLDCSTTEESGLLLGTKETGSSYSFLPYHHFAQNMLPSAG